MSEDIYIYNVRLVDRDMDTPGSLLIRDGVIAGVFREGEYTDTAGDMVGARLVNADGAILMPAFVDMHAHFRDPGFTQKEDLVSGSQAAAAGGYATVVLMANTNPVVSDRAVACEIRSRATGMRFPDVFQAVSLTRDFDGCDTTALAHLDPAEIPLVSEDGREVASAAVMFDALSLCAKTGVLVSCHCEDPTLAQRAKELRTAALADPANSAEHYTQAESLLRLAEDLMTERNLSLADAAGCRIHIAHVSTRSSLAAVFAAKKRRAGVSCEVTPHHLALTAREAEIVNPPLRFDEDRQALIQGLIDGTIDAIATDHAPHTESDKRSGAPGFSGIQTAFPVCNTILVRAGHLSLSALSKIMSANPAGLLGLHRGLLQVGMDADVVLLDANAPISIDPTADSWLSRGKNTPFAGKRFYGAIRATLRRGVLLFGTF
ncbi:MAG TPA: dihydroorotase [Treponema sp.]|nr:dihydroorotase [Treponema sp.]